MALSPAQALPEGRLFGGRWRVVRVIRAGGMGAVYEVVHRETQARSALKVMLPELVGSGELRARFKQEAMVTATIESDHIVKVFDGGTDPESGAPYLVMELLRGEDLAARVSARGALPGAEVTTLLRQAALALERTHAAGVVHRDLKPANLFLTTRDDGSPCLKVLDFGIAKMIASASRAETTRTVGTPLYMAPEQVKGDGAIAAPADRYALAQIAFTLLAGKPYWAEEQDEGKNVYPLLMAITAGTKEAASARAARAGVTLPEAFDAWFAKATALSPEERFGGAGEMIDALAEALGVPWKRVEAVSDPGPALRVSAPPGARPQTVDGIARDPENAGRRSRLLTAALGAAVVAVAVAAALSMRGGPERGGGPARPAAALTMGPQAAPNPGPPASGLITSTPAASTPIESPPGVATAIAAPAIMPSASPTATTSPAPSTVAPAPSPKAKPTSSAKAPPAAPPAPSDPSDVYRGDRAP